MTMTPPFRSVQDVDRDRRGRHALVRGAQSSPRRSVSSTTADRQRMKCRVAQRGNWRAWRDSIARGQPPARLIGLATPGDVARTLVAALPAGHDEAAMLKAPGLSIVLAALALNPEIHSAGRYRLPTAPSIVGVLAFEPLRQRSLTVISLPTAIGAAASGPVASHADPTGTFGSPFMEGYPPRRRGSPAGMEQDERLMAWHRSCFRIVLPGTETRPFSGF